MSKLHIAFGSENEEDVVTVDPLAPPKASAAASAVELARLRHDSSDTNHNEEDDDDDDDDVIDSNCSHGKFNDIDSYV